MSDENKKEEIRVQADNNSIAIGNLSAGGNIGDVNIQTGYTTEQVAILIAQIQSTFQPKPFDGRCPYKGLDVFEEEDAELFFGREKLVDDLVNRVKESRTVFVTGPSGSGKSSLARAGLIHALKQGAIKGSERWLYATMKPGRDPIGELGRVVSSLASSTNPEDEIRAKAMKDETIFARWCEIVLKDGRDKRLVLFIDQFEEVFTQISNEEERVAFLNLLTHAATIENGRVIILFSMRSDFVSNCATYPQLNALLNQQFVQIGAMQPEELVSAIAQPALRVGLRIDPDLIAQIINEMKGEPGALPLMQFALKDLFDSQHEKSGVPALILNDYLQRGGIHKALERHADDSFSKLSKDEQDLARSIFSGLIEIGRGTQDTKRTALFDELVPANTKAADVEAIVQKLADARLITTDEAAGKDTVTISHEKLIDAWPWLKKLVNENRDVIALQNEITADAKEWEDRKRDASYLYTGGRLANVREQVEKQKLTFNQLTQEFIRAGRTRQRRTQVFLTSAVSLILIAAIIASVIFQNQAQVNNETANTAQAASTLAFDNASTAQANEKISRSRELVAFAVANYQDNSDLSLLLSIEAMQKDINYATKESMLKALLRYQSVKHFLPIGNADNLIIAYNQTKNILAVSPSIDYKTVLSSEYIQSQITLWDINSGQTIGQPIEVGGAITKLEFSQNGEMIFAREVNHYGVFISIRSWNIMSHQILNDLYIHNGNSENFSISPDSKIIAIPNSAGVDLLDSFSGESIGQLSIAPSIKDPNSSNPTSTTLLAPIVPEIKFSPDGTKLGYSGFLWDVPSRQLIGDIGKKYGYNFEIGSNSAFSPDSQFLAVVETGRASVQILNTSDLSKVSELIMNAQLLTNGLQTLNFSPDGKTLFAGSNCQRALGVVCESGLIAWDVESQGVVWFNKSGDSHILGLSLDGKTVITSGSSGRNYATVWNLDGSLSLGKPITTCCQIGFAFNPQDKTLMAVISGHTGEFSSKDIKTELITQQQIINNEDLENITAVAFSSDGRLVAFGGCEKESYNPNYGCAKGKILLWDLSNQKMYGALTTHPFSWIGIKNLAFSPNNKVLASANGDGTISIWDVPVTSSSENLHEKFTSPDTNLYFNSVAFSPDGKILASGGCRSNDGTILSNCPEGTEGNVTFWDLNTNKPIIQMGDKSGNVSSIAYSPDGKILASGSRGGWSSSGYSRGEIILWDTSTYQAVSKLLNATGIASLAFSPDGKTIAFSTDETYGKISLWDISSQQFIGESIPITIFDLGIGPNYGRPLASYPGIPHVEFSPDGTTLATVSGIVILWDINPGSWLVRACDLVGRNFSRVEWAKYFPNEEYRKTCEQWPLEPEATASPMPTP